MTALPAISEFTGSSVTEGQFKTAIANLRLFLAGLLSTDGTATAALATMGVVLSSVADKTAAYTVVAGDRGKVIRCSGTFTLGITDAATLGTAFAFAVFNAGTGVVTIDPASTQTIDGSPTKTIAAGRLAIVFGDGEKFATVGGTTPAEMLAGLLDVDGSGSGLDADTIDGIHSAGLVKTDHGHNVVGSFCFARLNTNEVPGGTHAGSSLGPCGINDGGELVGSGALSGTWRCLGYSLGAYGVYTGTLFQRIA